MADLHLRPDQRDQVVAILEAHLPLDARVRVFGSRAAGLGVRPHSDLDLLLDAPEPLPISLVGDMAEAFSESDLAFRVDLLQRQDASSTFLNLIQRAGTIALPIFPTAP